MSRYSVPLSISVASGFPYFWLSELLRRKVYTALGLLQGIPIDISTVDISSKVGALGHPRYLKSTKIIRDIVTCTIGTQVLMKAMKIVKNAT